MISINKQSWHILLTSETKYVILVHFCVTHCTSPHIAYKLTQISSLTSLKNIGITIGPTLPHKVKTQYVQMENIVDTSIKRQISG